MDFDEREKKLERKNLEQKKQLDKVVDSITEIAMKERRKNIIDNPRAGSPYRMREDPTTPLIREVPFGPDTRKIENLEHGNPKNYDHPSLNMTEFDKFEAEQNKLPQDKAFPLHHTTTRDGQPISFRVISHGGISIPKEQERKHIPFEKRDWEHGRLKARSKRTHQMDEDAKEIALDIMNDETPSRFVNRKTKKIRPSKPVRSDYASIITAEHGFQGIINKETTFKVGEHGKPEFVSVIPLSFRTHKNGKRYAIKKAFKQKIK